MDLGTLWKPRHSLDNGAVIADQAWVDRWQATRFCGLRVDHGQEADQAGEVSR